MSPHQFGYYALLATAQGGMKIRDPGDGATFTINKSFGVCLLTIAQSATESRLLPSPTSGNGIGIGTRIAIAADVVGNSGTCTISDGNSHAFLFDTAGQVVEFVVTQIDGTKVWLGQQVLQGITASATELNILDGVTATTTELNNNCDASARIVAVTGTQLTLGAATHGGKTVMLDNTHTVTVTLPAASGGGDRYRVVVQTLGTDGSKLITRAGSDVLIGGSVAVNTQSTTLGFQTTTATTVTFNNTTTGGKIGSVVELEDIAAAIWAVRVFAITSGNPATPFS